MSKGKYLALDHGQRRIGVAISDENKDLAFPRAFIKNTEGEWQKALDALVAEESVTKIILGLPITLGGEFGESALKAHAFGARLQKRYPGVPVEYLDERLTTREAERLLRGQGVKAKDQKSEKDSVSAAILLETYLSQQKHR